MTPREIIHVALGWVLPQFRLDPHRGDHGVPHWSRVWKNGRMLAREMGLNPAVLAWFAYLHDSQRHGECNDPRHGPRAAEFARSLHERRVIRLERPEMTLLCDALAGHSDGHTEAHPVIQACWDSDRLDLGRVGIRPDPRYLCTAFAQRRDVIAAAYARSTSRPPANRRLVGAPISAC